jgi:hypothetical protein
MYLFSDGCTVLFIFLNEAISFFEESPKCHFYKYIYDDHNLQFYLSRPVNYMFKPLINRYRLHAHSLNIETGRYYNIDSYGHHIYTYRNDILAILQKKKLPHLKKYL